MKNNYRKCPHCKSIWVCWNWLKFDKKWMKENNPIYYKNIELKDVKGWGHECWDCTDVFETHKKVLDGIPYKKLCKDYASKGRKV